MRRYTGLAVKQRTVQTDIKTANLTTRLVKQRKYRSAIPESMRFVLFYDVKIFFIKIRQFDGAQ